MILGARGTVIANPVTKPPADQGSYDPSRRPGCYRRHMAAGLINQLCWLVLPFFLLGKIIDPPTKDRTIPVGGLGVTAAIRRRGR